MWALMPLALSLFNRETGFCTWKLRFKSWPRYSNWNDKVENLRSIAEEINIGVDSLVFLDDNPVERENVRMRLPEVLVPELPSNPLDYAPFLRGLVAGLDERIRGCRGRIGKEMLGFWDRVVERCRK